MENEHRLTQLEDLAKGNQRRIEALEKSQQTLTDIATSVAVISNNQKNMSDKVDGLCNKIDVLEKRPIKRWDKLIETVLACAATAVITYLLAGGGL